MTLWFFFGLTMRVNDLQIQLYCICDDIFGGMGCLLLMLV